jgi:hypothetical protein
MFKPLLTVNALSIEVGLDKRQVAKRPDGIPPDAHLDGRPAWHITTFLRASGADRALCEVGRRSGPDGETSRAVEELEAAAEAVSDGLERLRGEPDLAIRRDIARTIGGMIGRLDAAFSTSTAKMLEAERLVVQPLIDLAVGYAISQLLTLCEWRLERIN